jgi:hypothetical protein
MRLSGTEPYSRQSSHISTCDECDLFAGSSMNFDPSTDYHAIAQDYFRTTQKLQRLGYGMSGTVYLSPDTRTAVKVHYRYESFAREYEVYRKLRHLKISRLHGLTIPKLRDQRADVNLIRMDTVSAPYLLDFAGVLFESPEFTQDVMADWHARIENFFGPNAGIAYAVYNALLRHDMYYMDLRPSNLKLDGHPDFQPHDPGHRDDPSPY